MCQREQPRGAVHLNSGVAPVAIGRLCGVQCHADREVDGEVPQIYLGLYRRRSCVRRRRERRAQPVAAGVEHIAVVAFDGAPHDDVVEAHYLGHGRRVVLPAACRVRHVGEQEGDRSRWERAAHARTVTRRRPAGRSCTAADNRPRCDGAQIAVTTPDPHRAVPRTCVDPVLGARSSLGSGRNVRALRPGQAIAPSRPTPSFCEVFGTRIRPRFGLQHCIVPGQQ